MDVWASRGGLGVLVALSISSASFGRSFGPDTTSTGVFTGTETGLQCSRQPRTHYLKCSGFLASDVDGTALDVTVTVPPVTTLPRGITLHPLVVYVHGYGGSKNSDSSYDDMLASQGFAVLRHSTRGFGNSWGQVNLADINVEVADMRSLIGQVVDDQRLSLNGDAVAIAGASYGGGHSWLAAVTPRFTSPRNTPIRIRTIIPIAAWSDLLAALRPNGRPENSVEPPGFFKLSFLEALFLGGIREPPPLGPYPYPNYPDYLFEWNTYGLTTEPNNTPPIGSAIVDGLAGYRSVFWQQDFWNAVRANKGTADQLPILLIQGFTDDLFPVTEALRMYQNLRSIDPNYPVAAYFGDIGHPRAANKVAEINYALGLLLEWLDFHLLDEGTPSTTCGAAAPQLRCDVQAAITRLGSGFTPTDVIAVSSYDDLARASAIAKFGGNATITFDPANFSGYFADPVLLTGCEEFAPGSCDAPAPDVVPGDVATYTVLASDLAASAGLSATSFLIAGQPAVTLTATTAAPRIQLDARLYDVKPDGTRLLVTRGTFTLDSGSATTPIGSGNVKLVTYGNLWEVGTDDLVQLELTNVDSPYIEPSRIPSVTTLSNVKLTVPVR